ncbi:hypothetical protein GF382_01285 [Candidatus Falkowbacteria bacterium]|nr:hypothetical protein [Candidatus Falkowbacteria bacterium]
MKKEVKNKKGSEQDKVFLMWAGVIFFMVLISFFWIANMKNVFKTIDESSQGQFIEMDGFSEDFYDSMEELTNSFQAIEESVEVREPLGEIDKKRANGVLQDLGAAENFEAVKKEVEGDVSSNKEENNN